MNETISSTEAVRQMGDLLARIKHKGDRFILTRNNHPIAVLHPFSDSRRGTLAELAAALAKLPPTDRDFAADLEAVNMTDSAPGDSWQP